MQYADFIACGFNQIVNNLATTHYRCGASVPVTVRAPFGGHIGAGPFHSQSMEAWFCHVPGLKVVVPAFPEDAKGLLMAAIDDPNPVLFFEHKKLYRSIKGDVPTAPFQVPLGQARIVLPGIDLTLITYGIGVHWALEEAEHQREQGVSVEVIDLRTLMPWDRETVFKSIEKTNRALILHEAALTGGFGAELCATIAQEAFQALDAPPVRVAAADTPIPFSTSLERDLYSPVPQTSAGNCSTDRVFRVVHPGSAGNDTELPKQACGIKIDPLFFQLSFRQVSDPDAAKCHGLAGRGNAP